jgi:hypothetical protein
LGWPAHLTRFELSGLLLGVNTFGKSTEGNAWRLVRRSRLPYFKTGGSDMCQRAIFCLHVSASCARFPSTSSQAIPGSLVSTVCETHPTTKATTSREVSSSRRMHWKDSSFDSIFCFFFNFFFFIPMKPSGDQYKDCKSNRRYS